MQIPQVVRADPLFARMAPWLYLRGAVSDPSPSRYPFQAGREGDDWRQASQRTLAISDLEDSRSQVRSLVKKFCTFRRDALSPAERQTTPLPLQAVQFCHWNLPRSRAQRSVTVASWLRHLQSAFPGIRISSSPEARKCRKGLGKQMPLRPQPREVATTRQFRAFLEACTDAWQRAAVSVMGRAPGRLSDIRIWARGDGTFYGDPAKRTFFILNKYRKTDQEGSSAIPHCVGPFKAVTECELAACLEVLRWSQRGIRPVPGSYPSVRDFVLAIREAKRASNLQSVIALRRMRARHAQASLSETADLLGHEEGSRSTLGYMGDLPVAVKKRRIELSSREIAEAP